ncbi:MAG: hypothetical protein ACYTG2_04885 [Planctomycetota bacterium]
MSRSVGFAVFIALLLAAVLLRWHASSRAEGLIENEAHTRRTLAALYEASLEATRDGTRHPGLRGEFLRAFPEFEAIPDLGTEQITYARNGTFMFGLATRTSTDTRTSAKEQGFILRAWPLEYGATGDFEYQLADDGSLWQGQNLLGRSGTAVGFPPRFPDPGIGKPDEAWWIVPLPGHR